MSTDARLSTGLPAHPKTKKLIRRVGETGAWHLVCLILWARNNRPDGDLSGMTIEDIELAVDWRGEPDAFVAALCAVGFLDGEEGSYHLHDWEEHQPWANGSEMRSARARWNAVKRHHGEQEADRQVPEWAAIRGQNHAPSSKSAADSTGSDASSNALALPAASPSNAPSPSPSPSVRANPHTPADAGAAKGGRKTRVKTTFPTFLQACRDAGEKPIPANDPILKFADDTGIPREFVRLAWREFTRKHADSGRQQKDWRAHFRDAVRRNWFKLWWFPSEGTCDLTTAGVQLKRELEAEEARRHRQDDAA